MRFDTRMGPYIPYGEMSTRWQMLQGRYDFQYFGSNDHQLPGHQAYLQRGSKAAADLLVKRAVTWPFRERLKVVWTFFPDCTEQCRAQGLRVNSKARNEKIKASFDYFFRLDYELVERKVDTKRLKLRFEFWPFCTMSGYWQTWVLRKALEVMPDELQKGWVNSIGPLHSVA